MTFLRHLSSALDRLSDRMQGQDIERQHPGQGHRVGADYAALAKAHSSQGISPMGMGR
ncbi:MAG: hypothetical protein L0H74_04150 [Brachybacterium sp.]|nr:hypothetical protein [Brachybacterium sp.]MDN5899239.1 hypothetical protein [Brachybacterium sp.]